METVVGLLFLLGVSSGSYCDGRQDGAQCYGALGGSVVLQLMDNASEITRYDWKKNISGHEAEKRTLLLSVQDKLAIIGGVCLVLVILLVVAITVVWVKRKKLKSQDREEDQELTYADVRILPQKERQVEKTAEVEYGQVKFPQQPHRDT
ncbi:uncharacterized protein ACNS7B_012275 [Menidia menidia]